MLFLHLYVKQISDLHKFVKVYAQVMSLTALFIKPKIGKSPNVSKQEVGYSGKY